MAENTLKTRIQLKYDTIANWNSSSLVLKKGEIAIAEIPQSTSGSGLTPPAIGIKVGDGEKTFANLAWIQATAGDVYDWAKAAQKPSYAASEITGLSDYISGEIKDTNTKYQIVKSGNTYKLQKKDVDDDSYSDVADSVIDLTDIITRLGAVEDEVEGLDVSDQIETALGDLSYTDNKVAHQFVTTVSQEDGVISIDRAALVADDIPDLAMTKITGLSAEFAKKQDTLTFNTPYDASTNKAATMADITSATAGLSGAMHFKGSVDSLPASTSGYSDGDVIVVGNKEYVASGSTWIELGDEAIYAVKGNIVDADIAANAAIATSKIAGLDAKLNTIFTESQADAKFVAKNGTDHLMTDAQDSKLENIEANAQVNKIEKIKLNGVEQTITSKEVNLQITVPTGALADLDEVSEDELDSDLAAKINGKADKSSLAAIATSGEVKDLKQTDDTILVLSCGTATTVI